MPARPILFLKAHIDGYTRDDGTFVRPHEDARPTRRVIHATEAHFEHFVPPAARGVQSQHSRAESNYLWFGDADAAEELTDMFGPNVAEADLTGDLKEVRYRDYDADPIYDPDVMERILRDHQDAPGLAIKGVRVAEQGPKRTIYAVRDPNILSKPQWRIAWDQPLQTKRDQK